MYNRAEFSRARRQTIQKNGTPLFTVRLEDYCQTVSQGNNPTSGRKSH